MCLVLPASIFSGRSFFFFAAEELGGLAFECLSLEDGESPQTNCKSQKESFLSPLTLAASFQNYSLFRLDPCKSSSNRDREGGHISCAPEKNNLTFL